MGKDLKGKELGEGLCQIKDGRYVGRYTDRFGKRHSVYGKKLKETKEKLIKAKYEEDMYGGKVKPTDITLDELYEMWVNWKKTQVKMTTLSRQISDYKNHIQPKFGMMKISNIKKKDVQEFVDELHNNMLINTVKLVKQVLSNILKYAEENNMLQSNVCKHIKIESNINDIKKKKFNQETKYLTEEEISGFFSYCEKNNWSCLSILKLLLFTGLRVGEALALRWNDIDFNNKIIKIYKTYGCFLYEGKYHTVYDQTPKTQCSVRDVPMCRQAIELLVQMRSKRDIVSGDDFIFINKNGNPHQSSTLQANLRNLIKKYNKETGHELVNVTPHTFRHTFATRSLESGVPLKVVQKILGHSNIAITANLYTHVSADFLQENMDKIDFGI